MLKREIDDQELCHDRLGDQFAQALSSYDTQRRMEVLVDEFLAGIDLQNKRVLEVGCGLGFFSERLHARGADLIACDIGPNLVEATRRRVGCRCEVADALNLVEQFGSEQFDLVLSSECVEHTPDPQAAIRQMARVLKPGGRLSLSTPNIVWWPVVRGATLLRLRPFDGYENFSSWRSIRRILASEQLQIEREKGLHLFPFQLPAHGLSRWVDTRCQWARSCMINICVLAVKRT